MGIFAAKLLCGFFKNRFFDPLGRKNFIVSTDSDSQSEDGPLCTLSSKLVKNDKVIKYY